MFYFQLGCFGYVAYVMDTQDKGKVTADDLSIARVYPDVFPEDMHGVPPERQVDFRIDLVPGADQIAKVPYRLAPPEM